MLYPSEFRIGFGPFSSKNSPTAAGSSISKIRQGLLGAVHMVCGSVALLYVQQTISVLIRKALKTQHPVKTTRITVYDTLLTYNVTAGVGPFNASYVQPYFDYLKALSPDYEYEVLPYSSYAIAYDLVTNPTYATESLPISCQDGECDSYLLSGGVLMTTPWIPTGYSMHPVVKIDSVPAVQLDFEKELDEQAFSDTDCITYGADGVLIAIRMCLQTHESRPGSLIAGEYRQQSALSCQMTFSFY